MQPAARARRGAGHRRLAGRDGRRRADVRRAVPGHRPDRARLPSIEIARKRAAEAGVADRVRFEVADATGYPTEGYDLICYFDALHDLGDPVGAAAYARQALAADGTLLLVEPLAFDDLATNLAHNPGAAMHYGASTFLCVANSLAQPVGLGLGAQAGEPRLRAVLAEAGYGTVRRAADNRFNMVLEARP